MPRRTLTVAIADDHEVVVRGLQAMLSGFPDRVRVVALGAGGHVDQPVDVILLGGSSSPPGRAPGRQVPAGDDDPALVVYSWHLDPTLVQRALSRGCRGYLGMWLDAPTLVSALERVRDGEIVVAGGTPVTGRPAGQLPGRPAADAGLSAREAEVVALVTQGLTNQDIAARTYLSINSVKTYIRSAYRKMGVTRRSQAVRWGLEHGLGPGGVHGSGPQQPSGPGLPG